MTTDAGSLEAFWEKHGQIAYKSISGVRSIVTCSTPSDRERFADLSHGAVFRVSGVDAESQNQSRKVLLGDAVGQ